MALPLAPLAVAALKYGSVAATVYGITRSVQLGRTDQSGEDALDRVSEGVTAHRPKDRAGPGGTQGNMTARFRRIVRIGARGPGVEIDFASLARIKLRKV